MEDNNAPFGEDESDATIDDEIVNFTQVSCDHAKNADGYEKFWSELMKQTEERGIFQLKVIGRLWLLPFAKFMLEKIEALEDSDRPKDFLFEFEDDKVNEKVEAKMCEMYELWSRIVTCCDRHVKSIQFHEQTELGEGLFFESQWDAVLGCLCRCDRLETLKIMNINLSFGNQECLAAFLTSSNCRLHTLSFEGVWPEMTRQGCLLELSNALSRYGGLRTLRISSCGYYFVQSVLQAYTDSKSRLKLFELVDFSPETGDSDSEFLTCRRVLAQFLEQQTRLQSVYLVNGDVTTAVIMAIGNMPSLRTLVLQHPGLSDLPMSAAMAPIHHALEINGVGWSDGMMDVLAASGALPFLRELHQVALSDVTMSVTAAIGNLPSLRELVLDRSGLTDVPMSLIAAIGNMPFLRKLVLKDAELSVEATDRLFRELANKDMIQHLDLENNDRTALTFQASWVEQLPRLSKLRELHLRGSHIIRNGQWSTIIFPALRRNFSITTLSSRDVDQEGPEATELQKLLERNGWFQKMRKHKRIPIQVWPHLMERLANITGSDAFYHFLTERVDDLLNDSNRKGPSKKRASSS
mmetsp:Transcript_29535/g.81186  ORF Transcript_29535/g.81186 Transcript_29535/m.81186 type:complete len:580 (+) Transcript_29535:3-1742(+)